MCENLGHCNKCKKVKSLNIVYVKPTMRVGGLCDECLEELIKKDKDKYVIKKNC